MAAERLLNVLAGIGILALLLALPVAVLLLHRRVRRLEGLLANPTPARYLPGPAATPEPAACPALPPPLPQSARPGSPPPLAPTPDPLVSGLRRLGLLPPEGLRGEGALGAWIAARVGGALALAAVVFLGVWLNLVSTLPSWMRLAQVVLLGAGAAGTGAWLSRRRPDLGLVVTALGLGILQFSAWAAHGLSRMRVLESPMVGAMAQLGVAAAIGLAALRLGSERLAQLAAWFLTLSGVLAAATDAGVLAHALHLVALAALGGLTLWRRGWTSVAWVSLAGTTVLGLALPADESVLAPAAALASLLLLWLPTQALTRGGSWTSGRSRSALTFASVALPSVVLVAGAPWSEILPSSLASLAAAAACALAGLRERRLGGAAGDALLAAGLVFAAAAGAWALAAGLDWLPWALAAAAAHLLGRQSAPRLMEWTCDLLSAGAIIGAARAGPAGGPAEILLGIGGLSLLLGLRGSRLLAAGAWRAALPASLLGLLLLARFPGDALAPELKGLAWLLPALAALGTRSALPALAAAPVLLLAQFQAWDWVGAGPSGRPAIAAAWSVLLLLAQAGGAAWLARQARPGWSRALSVLAGISLLTLALHLSALAVPALPEAGLVGWALAAPGGWAIVAGLRRLGATQGQGLLLTLAIGMASLLPAAQAALPPFGLAWSPAAVAGALGFLALVARESRGLAWSGAPAAIAAAAFLLATMAATAHLPGFPGRSGYQSTVVWLVTSALGFALGQVGGSRPVRLTALAFLGLATLKLVAWDIDDLVGRIIACAVAAAAFLGVAWAYARRPAAPAEGKGGID